MLPEPPPPLVKGSALVEPSRPLGGITPPEPPDVPGVLEAPEEIPPPPVVEKPEAAVPGVVDGIPKFVFAIGEELLVEVLVFVGKAPVVEGSGKTLKFFVFTFGIPNEGFAINYITIGLLEIVSPELLSK
jgi:hypothetical protein